MSEPSLVTVGQIADLAEVVPSAVSNWRRRFGDFPTAVQAAPSGSDLFELQSVERWLKRHDRLGEESRSKGLIFSAGDVLRSEVPGSLMVEVLGAALALVASEKRRSAGSAAGPSVESLLAVAADPVDDGHDAFAPLLRIDRGTARRVLELVLRVDAEDLPHCLRWVLSRRHQGFEAQSGEALTGLIVALAGGEGTSIYDPAAGSGEFLLALWSQFPASKRPQLFGQELNDSAARIARQRFLIHDVPVSLAAGNTLLADAWPALRADVVVCDPPYGAKQSWPEDLMGDPRWMSGRPPGQADFAWLQHVVYHLADEGRGYAILPPGSLFRRGRESDLRRELLAEGVVEAIVGLPRGSAPGTGIPLALWILRRPGRGGERDSVLMIDSTIAVTSSRPKLDRELTARIAGTVHQWRAGRGIAEQGRALAAAVPVLDLLRRDANLAPARWMSAGMTDADRDRREGEFDQAVRSLAEARAALVSSQTTPDLPAGRPLRQWTPVEQLVEDHAVQTFAGSQIRKDDFIAKGAPVIRATDVVAGLRESSESFVDLAALKPSPVLTMPGDVIIVATGGQLAAAVDRRGGSVLAAPIQALRLTASSMEPDLVAVFLASPRNRRFFSGTTIARAALRELEVPVLPSGQAKELLAVLNGLKEQEELAEQIGADAQRLREILLDLASAPIATPVDDD
jgi:hypothetical protein